MYLSVGVTCHLSNTTHLCLVFPTSQCKLRLLKLERVKDFLIIEEEYIRNQELLKPKQAKDDVSELLGTAIMHINMWGSTHF